MYKYVQIIRMIIKEIHNFKIGVLCNKKTSYTFWLCVDVDFVLKFDKSRNKKSMIDFLESLNSL